MTMLEHFAIVLVGVQNSGNVGSVARSMFNMGLQRLVLVAPECDPLSPEAERMARDAKPILPRRLRWAVIANR